MERVYRLKEVKGSFLWDKIFRSLYGEPIEFDHWKEALEIAKIAIRFKFEKLQGLCKDYLLRRLDFSNVRNLTANDDKTNRDM